MIGFYLIAFADVRVGDDYIELDQLWRASLLCHALGFLSIFAVLIETFLMLDLSIERYRVVKYPLSGRSSMNIQAVLPITFAILIIIVLYIRHQVKCFSYLSSLYVFYWENQEIQ